MTTTAKKATAKKPAAKKTATKVSTTASSIVTQPEAQIAPDVPLVTTPPPIASDTLHVDTSTLAGVADASRGKQTMPLTQQQLDAKVRELLLADDPQWAVFFDRHSEIYRAILDLYVRDNGYLDPTKLKNTIIGTNEWRTLTSSQRQEMMLKEQDPATWQAKRDQLASQLASQARRLGVTVDAQSLWSIADQAYTNGWQGDNDRLQSLLLTKGSVTGGGQIAGYAASVRQKLVRYGLPVNDSQVADWARQIADGSLAEASLDEMIRNQAKAKYPHLANIIDQGLTPEDFYAPYKSALANELEINPETIDFSDPKWSAVVDGGATGRPMTMTEAARYARSLPEWRTTDRANAKAASLERSILSVFGKVA